MADIYGQSITSSLSNICGKRRRQAEYVPDGIDFTPGGAGAGDGRIRIYDAKRTKNLPSVLLDSSSTAATSYFCNADPTVDAKLGINTRTPTHNLHVVQTNPATPLARFTMADGTTHPITIDELGNTTLVGSTTIHGDLDVAATLTTIYSLNVTSNFLVLNSDLGAGTPPTEDCGGTIRRGVSTDFNFVWRESDDTFVIGLVGSESAVATRHDTPTDDGIMIWNDTAKRFDNYSNFIFTGSRLGVGTSTAFPSPLATLHVVGEGSDDPIRIDDQASDTTFFKIDSNGIATFGDTTEATSTSAASVVVSGGLAIAKRLIVGGTINSLGNIQFDSSVSGTNVVSSTDTNGHLHLVTEGTGKVTVTSGGAVLSGTPAALLHVQYSGSESGIDCFRVDDAATTDSSYFHVEQDGRVGINCGAVQTIAATGGTKPVMQVTGLQSNTGPECLAMYTGSDGVGAGGLIIERVSGGSWTTTGAMISAGFHYGETDGTIVYDNTHTANYLGVAIQLGKAIHFDTTNSIIKFLSQTVNAASTPGVFPELALDTYSSLQLEFGSTTRGVFVRNTTAANSGTNGAFLANSGINVAGDIIVGNAAINTTARVSIGTVSTSTTTGSGIVAGGVGVGQNLFMGANFNAVGTGATSTFNDQLVYGLITTSAGGSMSLPPVIDATTSHSMTSMDTVVFMTNTSTRTITLQACATAGVGRIVRFHEAGGSTNVIDINTVSSEIIYGGGVASSTTRSISTAYGYISLITNGTEWYVLSTG